MTPQTNVSRSPTSSVKRVRIEDTPIILPTSNNAMSSAKAAFASGLLTLHSSLRLHEEQSNLFDSFIKKYKKLKEKETSIMKFSDNEHIPHSIRIIVPELKSSDTVSSTTRFKEMVTEFNDALNNFKSTGVALFKEAAEMEIRELKNQIVSDFKIFLNNVLEVSFIRFEASREPLNLSDMLQAVLSKNGNLYESEKIKIGLSKLGITDDNIETDAMDIAVFCKEWTNTAPGPISPSAYNPAGNTKFIIDCKNAIANTYFAAIIAYDSFVLKKQEEDKITKHLTSLTVNKAAEDTTMEFNELPAIESEASLKLLIRTLMDEDAKKEGKKSTIKKDKSTTSNAKNGKEGHASASLKKKKKKGNTSAVANPNDTSEGRRNSNRNQTPPPLNRGQPGGRGRGRGRGRNATGRSGGRAGRGRGRH